jgi:hypothetical protein
MSLTLIKQSSSCAPNVKMGNQEKKIQASDEEGNLLDAWDLIRQLKDSDLKSKITLELEIELIEKYNDFR